MVRSRTYSRDEWTVLLYYFRTEPEPTHTDSHPALQRFARQIGRTPGKVDASLRNIKLELIGTAGFEHGSSAMREITREYGAMPVTELREAAIEALSRVNPTAALP